MAIRGERCQERRHSREPQDAGRERQPGGKKNRRRCQRGDHGDHPCVVGTTDPTKPAAQTQVVVEQTPLEFGDCRVDLLVVHREIPYFVASPDAYTVSQLPRPEGQRDLTALARLEGRVSRVPRSHLIAVE